MKQIAGKVLLSIIIFSTLFWACEPCDDCGPENTYPYFKLSILNKSSLDTLIVDKARIETEIDSIDDALANPDNSSIQQALNNAKTVKSDSLTLINDLIKDTNSKLISIASINGEKNLFEDKNGSDSLKLFRIPINTNQDESDYAIAIEFVEKEEYLKIKYELFDTIINNKITKSAKSLEIIEHSFDSIRGPFGCTPINECISNQLEIYVEI
ncbi:hypothetical protein QYS48_10050 [Marivirga arenosa]|uniref:Lipoprotein n=1 Tax=Marivirga arenosa TaxID=3059076 RepID=A0AA49JE76_9BACT|nr:hypothetical protein [Marivirga sp. ABR2-2]WKK87117.1 hypothetical protein QYS48_10050 [Marivirga sp. ABR2-2]